MTSVPANPELEVQHPSEGHRRQLSLCHPCLERLDLQPGVGMPQVYPHTDFTSPATVPLKSCQILGERTSSAGYPD